MSNKLKLITTKAKALYKTGKYAKWTDAIKAASKGIGAVKKKSAPKKAVVKKKSAPKKSAAKKKVATKKSSYHKDTKSHNVNIRVMSGINVNRAMEIASHWHNGQWSALYQFASSGKILKENYQRYLNELPPPADLTTKDKNNIVRLITYIHKEYKRLYSGKKFAGKVSGYKKTTRKGRQTTVHYTRIGSLPKYKDIDAAREIQLFADNDSSLYFRRKLPILKNLEKKYKKGNYDIDKAAKLWRYFIDDALQSYNKEFGSRGDKWHELLNTSDRQLLALEYAKDTLRDFNNGEFYD